MQCNGVGFATRDATKHTIGSPEDVNSASALVATTLGELNADAQGASTKRKLGAAVDVAVHDSIFDVLVNQLGAGLMLCTDVDAEC